jgi:transketolase
MATIGAELDQLCVETIKFLSADAVEKANSGHPGAPMGGADLAFVLWSKFLRFDPKDPHWLGRDRFVLSNGHASMLLYSLLHLFGFDLSLEDIRQFRQFGSRTPGHPERGHAPGVEATTGPLGQGFGNGVGMALAHEMTIARYPELEEALASRVFGIVSDGDLMEGVASEAASLAGHLRLGNLIYLYDDNHISIEGSTALAFTEDVAKRFDAYGWHTKRIDGHDHHQIEDAIQEAIQETKRPSLILARTLIGKGAPTKAGTAKVHGEPLGPDELKRTKEAAGWPLTPEFYIPPDALERFRALSEEKRAAREEWNRRYDALRARSPEAARRFESAARLELPEDLEARLLAAVDTKTSLATRAWSGKVIQAAARAVPWLVGGSADLGPSTITDIDQGGSVGREALEIEAPVDYSGRTLHFGVREHGMGAIVNGIALHGGFIPYGATFMVFSDYMRPSIRLAALTRLRSIFLFTHDSVFLGEDGPTHQPIEQLPSLRLMPNLDVWRPADGPETAAAWASAIRRTDGPTAMALTRQKLAPVGGSMDLAARGGYVLREGAGGGTPVTLVASGSETPLAVSTADLLAKKGIAARVVSMPCVDVFQRQPEDYRREVLPTGVAYVVVEAAQTDLWAALVGADSLRIGLDHFGASAPAEVIAKEFGFTPDAVADRIQRWLPSR